MRSCRDGQLLNYMASFEDAGYQYLVPILSPVTDYLLILNQRKRGKLSIFLHERLCGIRGSISSKQSMQPFTKHSFKYPGWTEMK